MGVVGDVTRRIATMLFADIVESTQAIGRLGDARWASLLAQHHEIVADALARHGGRDGGSSGDGFLALFDVPLHAIRCAAELRDALTALGLQTRIGVHCGEIELIGDAVAGLNVHVAARIMSRAAADELLVSSTVRELVNGAGVSFRPRGMHRLRGIADEWRLYAVDVASVPSYDAVPVDEQPLTLPLPAAAGTLETLPFPGRADEQARLAAAWSDACAGRARCVVVGGEPGAGKTRLVTEFARTVHDSGGQVLWGRCDDGLSVPFQPLVEALDHVVTHATPRQLRRVLGDSATELARLVPRIRQILPDLGEPTPSDPDTERYRLFEAGADALRRAGNATPTLLVVDDAHWATTATLLFLRHLVQRSGDMHLLLVVTYRDTVPDLTDDLVAWLGDLSRLSAVQRIALGGLPEQAVAALIDAVMDGADRGAIAPLARRIHQRTAGNALFTTQLLRHLDETGTGRTPARIDGPGALPPEIRDVISHRLLRLPPLTREVLTEAAVLGQQFSLDVLTVMTPHLSALEVLRALDAGVRAHLVDEAQGGRLHYRFTHALVVDAILDASSSTWLRDAHLRAAAAWETTSVTDPSWATTELARHHVAASLDPVKEQLYNRAAGDTAMAALAYSDAVTFYRQALDAADRCDAGAGDTGRDAAELLLSLALAEAAAGDATYRLTLEKLWRAAVPLGDQGLLVRAAMAIVRGNWSSSGEVDRDRIGVLEAALDSGPLPDPTRARLLAQLAAELSWSHPDRRRREALADEALQLAPTIPELAERLRVIGQCASAAQHPDNVARIGAVLDEYEPLLDEVTDPVVALQAAWTWLTYAGMRGEPVRLRRQITRMERLVDCQPVPLAVYLAEWIRLTMLFLSGRFDEVLARCDPFVSLGASLGQGEAGMIVAYYQLLIGHLRGDTAELLPLLEAYAEVYAEGLPGLQVAVAMFRASIGDTASAKRTLNTLAADDFHGLRQDQSTPLWLAWAADTAHRTLATEHAATLYPLLHGYADQIVSNGGYMAGSMHHWLGLLADTLGNPTAADAHFAAAIDAERALGMTYWEYASRAVAAASRLRRGDESRRDELRDVRGLARAAGYLAIVRDIDAALVLVSHPPAQRGPSATGATHDARLIRP
jgi:class 3 adenylate cyclase